MVAVVTILAYAVGAVIGIVLLAVFVGIPFMIVKMLWAIGAATPLLEMGIIFGISIIGILVWLTLLYVLLVLALAILS